MTTEIEKTFFDTFGIKPKKGCTAYDKFTEEEADAIAYKVLTMWQYISRIADAMRGPTFATRFNSISNAVGPQIVDNLIMEYKQS